MPPATSTETTRRSPSASTKSRSGIGPNAAVPTITRAIPASASATRVRHRAHAAAELHGHGRRGVGHSPGELDRRAAVARRAERDHVDERGRRRGGPADERQRVARVHLDAVVVAPQQPDGTAVEHVDGGDDCELL